MDLGLERAGMECAWQVEIDEFCRKVLTKHWPNAPKFNDVRECGKHNLERVDLIAGGDPCQRNSNAWRHGDGDASLGGEFIRIVDQLRPRLVLRENPATLRADAPWPWWRFRSELERLDYAVLSFRLRACCVGADFKRERVFLFAELQKPECAGLERDVSQVLARAHEGRQDAYAAGPDRWSATPRICRRADGIPNRMDRLKSLGNAVVPQIAEWIGRRIIEATFD